MRTHSDCYGKMFVDFTKLKYKEPLEGQAFTALIRSPGIGGQGRTLEVKAEAWEQCLACPEYRTCYDLSLAKMHMFNILMNTMAANPWVGMCA